MKITLKIPDWAARSNLYLITRNELVAVKMAGQAWRVKSRRCNQCGRCCEVHPTVGAYFPVKPDGSCVHLRRDGDKQVCAVGMEKPLACVLGEPEGQEYVKYRCCIEYR